MRLNLIFSTAGCGRACPGAQLAAQLPAEMRHRKASWASLAALLLPGVLFGADLVLLRDHPQFTWLRRAAHSAGEPGRVGHASIALELSEEIILCELY